jgi:hypothetical protein
MLSTGYGQRPLPVKSANLTDPAGRISISAPATGEGQGLNRCLPANRSHYALRHLRRFRAEGRAYLGMAFSLRHCFPSSHRDHHGVFLSWAKRIVAGGNHATRTVGLLLRQLDEPWRARPCVPQFLSMHIKS